MRLLADVYMKKGGIHQGEEAAVKVTLIIIYKSAALSHIKLLR